MKNQNTISSNNTNDTVLLNNSESQEQAQLQTQLLECLEKLEVVIANQHRLEQQLAALGILEAANTQARASLNV